MTAWVELEQVERLKKWCRDYGAGILLGIILLLIASMGWCYWQTNREEKLVKASVDYEQLVDAITHQREPATWDTLTTSLVQHYPKTPYASLAVLQLAKQAVARHQLAEAENKLLWVVQRGSNATLRAVARARLARVLLAEHKAADALTLLDENDNPAYQSLILEEKGDILLHLGRDSEALQSYWAAEQSYSKSVVAPPLLVMKINNLVGVATSLKSAEG